MPEPQHTDEDLGMGGLEATAATPHDPTVVQFGSEICAHCPAATLLLSQLTAVGGGNRETVMVYQGLRGDQVKGVVEKHCARRLVLDADF